RSAPDARPGTASALARAHGPAFSADRALSRPLPRPAAKAQRVHARRRARRALATRAGVGVPRPTRAAQGERGADRAGGAVRTDKCFAPRHRKELRVENRPFRLITSGPLEGLARTLEALLVVASAPLSGSELAEAARDDEARVESALELLSERFREGRSGIVLEHVAGGYAFRASRSEAVACARLVERPVERGLSQAALETLAVAAYLGPVSRPDLARLRGVAADT